MDDEPLIIVETRTPLQSILDAEEWAYLGTTVCEPVRDMIRPAEGGEGVAAWAVFDALSLDVLDLYRVYAHEDLPFFMRRAKTPASATDAPDAALYRALRHRVAYWHEFERWSRLSRLTGRIIRFHRDAARAAPNGLVTFYPDGRIEERLAFIRTLRDGGTFERYLAYKLGILAAMRGR
ncbi:hypothetical protein L0Y59_02490 [Candidatus Uhrbacteria bacterium]|nr:hypothetical protein [Candidatus Uhrbacteria bacterium]